MNPFGFHGGWPAIVMPIRPGFSLSQQALLKLFDQVFILAMRRDQYVQFARQPEGLKEVGVFNAVAPFVGQIDFERRDALFADDPAQLFFDGVIIMSHRHMKRIVASGLPAAFRRQRFKASSRSPRRPGLIKSIKQVVPP